ncbi:MAG: hypothetical protein U5K43_13365 [Halofilum sp. (in: g-proteobacteria)]|nr:hypothetical protein [Halofilum sp. (in: g-proteobacteria)]
MIAPAWRPVIAVAGWQAAASLCYYSLFAATAYFRDSFALSRTLVGALVTVAMLGYTLNLFPSGAAVDGFGERRVMLVGLLGLALTAGLVGAAPTYAVPLGGGVPAGRVLRHRDAGVEPRHRHQRAAGPRRPRDGPRAGRRDARLGGGGRGRRRRRDVRAVALGLRRDRRAGRPLRAVLPRDLPRQRGSRPLGGARARAAAR